jgi:hypothetical protein
MGLWSKTSYRAEQRAVELDIVAEVTSTEIFDPDDDLHGLRE